MSDVIEEPIEGEIVDANDQPIAENASVEMQVSRGRVIAHEQGGDAVSVRRNKDTAEWWVLVGLQTGFQIWSWSESDPNEVIASPVLGSRDEGLAAIETLATGGLVIQGTSPTPPAASPEEAHARLAWLKEEAKRRIDVAAENARLVFITPGTGQAMEYLATEAEADFVMNLPESEQINEGQFPMLDAEIGLLGSNVREVAQTVSANALGWRFVGASIKRKRRAAKEAVELATTEASIQSAMVVVWPTPGHFV